MPANRGFQTENREESLNSFVVFQALLHLQTLRSLLRGPRTKFQKLNKEFQKSRRKDDLLPRNKLRF